MNGIEAVLFDYGMVLSGPPDAAAKRRMEALLDADVASFRAAYWRSRDDYDRGSLTAAAYWREVATDLRRTLDAATLEALIGNDTELWTQPNERMIAWAAALQAAGLKTGILSNLGDAMEAGIIARFAWLQGFPHRTFSHRLGMAKPDAAIYRHAAQQMGVEIAAVLFIDDKEENIAGAHAAGMQAVRYEGHEAFVQAMESAGYGWLLSVGGRVGK